MISDNVLSEKNDTSSTASSCVAKSTNAQERMDKRNWFPRSEETALEATATTTISAEPLNNNNNNNEEADDNSSSNRRTDAGSVVSVAAAACGDATVVNNCKRKDEKNVFQRLKKKMGLHFSLLRPRKRHDSDGATTDASAEFVTRSPTREAHQPLSHTAAQQLQCGGNLLEDSDMVPFTLHFKRFVTKKWLERDEAPNRVMFKASSEMLSQVWYWGEISRRDAQRQLTDKPTGSFLVRDSETSGSQFTLSFRIVNVTLHYRLEYRENYWHFEELQYESIVEMIEDILYRCTNDNFVCFVRVPNEMQPPFPVILKYPLSRYLKMPPLQDLCRRVIQRHTSDVEIAKLPIPPKLHEYLGEKRELVF